MIVFEMLIQVDNRRVLKDDLELKYSPECFNCEDKPNNLKLSNIYLTFIDYGPSHLDNNAVIPFANILEKIFDSIYAREGQFKI